MGKQIQVKCDLCGADFFKLIIELHSHNFCCREHFYKWNRARIAAYNSQDNPMNKIGGVLESRIKRGNMLRGRGKGKAYRKYLGQHEHRRIGEMLAGRPLIKSEIVHHEDGNKLNNDPKNLRVLASQGDHARLHFTKKRGDYIMSKDEARSRGVALLME